MKMSKLSKAAIYLSLIILSLIYVFPFLWTINTSLKTDIAMFSIPPTWIPNPPTLQHYISVIYESSFITYLKNSLSIAIISTIIAMLIGTPAAYGFAKFKYRFSGLLLICVVAARMFPPVTLLFPFFILMRTLGLINTTFGLILTYIPIQLTIIIWILEGFFREFPRELEEAAELDGLGHFEIFYKVAVPLAKPAIGVAAVFAFLQAWNEFILALTLTRTPEAQTMPVGIAGYVTSFQTMWGSMTASATLFVIPALILTALIGQRWLIRGLTTGSLKG